MKNKSLLLPVLLAGLFTACNSPSDAPLNWETYERKVPLGGGFPVAIGDLTLHWSGSSMGEGFFYCYLFEGVVNTSDVTELEWEFPEEKMDKEALSIDVKDGDQLTAHHRSGRRFVIQVVSQTMDGQFEGLILKFGEIKPVQP